MRNNKQSEPSLALSSSSSSDAPAPASPLLSQETAKAATVVLKPPHSETRGMEALKQLFCGGIAGAAGKTATAPLSRLTILFQVHSMVTTKSDRPKFAMNIKDGFSKVVERGGIKSMWRGNGTSVLHRFPFSAINFFVYENMLDVMQGIQRPKEEEHDNIGNLQRRLTLKTIPPIKKKDEILPLSRFMAGAVAGSTACIACYPLDLVRTRLTTQLEGREHYSGMTDAFRKIHRAEGFAGFYSGLGPTLLVAVPNFAISYTVYGTLKEFVLDDDLFYNMRNVDDASGEGKLGYILTIMCGACSGILSTVVTFPFDTIRRRMQIQNLHIPKPERLTGRKQISNLIHNEGLGGIYRGLTPELLKVVPMVGTMFTVYELAKEHLNV